MSLEDIIGGVDTTPLEEDDLFEILELLKEQQAQCYKIATWLKLKPSTLNTIKTQTSDYAVAMESIITNWLQRNYNEKKFGPPTWRVLVEAVAAPNGGNHTTLAKKIAKLHQAAGSKTDSVSSPAASTEATDNARTLPSSNGAPSSSLPQPQLGDKDPNFFQTTAKQKIEVDGWGTKKKLAFERYPIHPKGETSHIQFSFGAVSMQSGEKRSIAGSYNMQCWPHGIAVVINNEEFKRQKDREGTETDEKNLIQVLRHLGYIVEVYRNCTAQKIADIMEENKLRDHWSYDSFICCILSHGKQGQIYGSDSVMVSLDDVTAKLNGDSCKSLAAKPKMFFMQACRGSLKDSGVNVDADDDEMEPEPRVLSSTGVRVATDSDSKIPSAKDFFFGYATASGHVAWRDLDNGSWYISELCRSLASYAKFASLNDMMTITNQRVGTTYTNLEYKQSTEATSRLGSDVFFF